MTGECRSGGSKVVGRFAPSPTGRMHLGNVFAALVSYLAAKSVSGEWILRIEDLDSGRCRPEYVRVLEDDLRFLGLEWDRGGSADPLYVQSRRGEFYSEALSRLETMGATYPCWCTRASLSAAAGVSSAPHADDGRTIYPGFCRDNPLAARMGAGKPYSVRLRVPDSDIAFTDLHYGKISVNLAGQCGDYVLKRSDGAWAYQLAVVVDDALMGVTQVVRGRDLLMSSAQQKHLGSLLGFPTPEYGHFPLLCAADGRRLCKRDRSLDMGELRKNFSGAEIIGRLAYISGITDSPEPCLPPELVREFSWNRLPERDIYLGNAVGVASALELFVKPDFHAGKSLFF